MLSVDPGVEDGADGAASNGARTDQTSTEKKKKKPRYSKAKKRELKQIRLEQEEAQRKLKQSKKRRRAKGGGGATTQAKAKKQEPKDEVDRILQCAEKSLFTDSIVVENQDEIITDSGQTTDENYNNNGDTNYTTTGGNSSHQSRLIVQIVSGCDLPEQIDRDETPSPSKTATKPSESNSLASLRHTMTCTIRVQPLLVLDLNGILCHRDRKRKRNQAADVGTTARHDMAHEKLRPSIGKVANTGIIPRTDLLECLHYLDQHFCLAIWTSAKPKTAKKLLNLLLSEDNSLRHKQKHYDCKGIRSRLLFVWSQSQCTKKVVKKSTPIQDTDGASKPEIPTNVVVTTPPTTKKEPTSTTTTTTSATIISSDLENTTIHEKSSSNNNNDGPCEEQETNNSKDNSKNNNENNPNAVEEDDDEHSFDDSMVFEKHLPKIWKAYPLWSAVNTLLIDDSPEKCPLAIQNTLHPPPLHGRRREPGRSPMQPSDQDNEDQQARFFRKLVAFWKDRPHASAPTTIMTGNDKPPPTAQIPNDGTMTNSDYYEFLQRHGRGHMGWRQEESTPN